MAQKGKAQAKEQGRKSLLRKRFCSFESRTEGNGPLAPFEFGATVHKVVRAIASIYKGEQGFGIYEVEENERRFVILGNFPYELVLNGFYHVKGEVTKGKKGEKQLKVVECEAALPTDKAGIVALLRSLPGIDQTAHKLYAAIGPNILDVIKNNPEEVAKQVRGIGLKRAKVWQAELLSRGEQDRKVKKLYDMGLSSSQAQRLIADYGPDVGETVTRNPYFLIGRVRGYSFKKADKLALSIGTDIRDPDRLDAGILHLLDAVMERGHCSYPKDAFFEGLHNLLDGYIGFQVADRLLRTAGEQSSIQLVLGAKQYDISLADLRARMEKWRNNPKRKSSDKFMYPVEPIDDALLEQALCRLADNRQLVQEAIDGTSFVTPHSLWSCEREVAELVGAMRQNEVSPFASKNAVIRDVLQKMGVSLEAKQMEAVERICHADGGIFILNGSAGCGKTFTLNIIMRVLTALHRKERAKRFDPCILAPTGKAAKVAAKATGLPAHTIHRALGIGGKGQDSCSLSNNCVVVDEFSMVDTILCAQMLRGIPKSAKLILLGDTEQLPSIRAGRVLKDLADSGEVPVITLDVVKRQGAQSGVLQNANRIIRGQAIDTVVVNEHGWDGNAYIWDAETAMQAQEEVLRVARKHGLRAFQQDRLQILCPLRSGATGVVELNQLLQQALNPKRDGVAEVVVGKLPVTGPVGEPIMVPQVFREGDCVIHTKNNYGKVWHKKDPSGQYTEMIRTGVVNGDTGVVDRIVVQKDGQGVTHRVIYVQYDDHYIAYDNEYDDLSLAYALTVHKSQGSQWGTIICPLVQPSILLNRKLLYTMYTRAQETNIIIGRRDLVQRAIHNNREDRRVTLLQARLRAICNERRNVSA